MTSKSPRVSNKKLYLVSYSIPLSCVAILLLVIATSVGTLSSYYSDEAEALDGVNSRASTAQPVVRLDISEETGDGYGNTETGQVTTAPGAGTAYRSHKIHVYGEDIASYDILISGPENLEPSSGANTVISGAGGASGSAMAGNTWGFAWGDLQENVTEMSYNSMGKDLTVTKANNPTNAMDYNKKLVFGANFGANAQAGTYTAGVTLSLVAIPKVIGQYWYNADGTPTYIDTGIDTMQDVDAEFVNKYCRLDGKANGNAEQGVVPVGATITLRDERPGYTAETMTGSDGKTHALNEYVIVKLKDGNCWMQENLRLNGGTAITPDDSDVKSDWTLPDGNTETWSYDSALAQMKNGEASMTTASDGGAWQTIYGNYYSYCAATADSCKLNRTGAVIERVDAAESICPRGWQMPNGKSESTVSSVFTDQFSVLNNLTFEEAQGAPYKLALSGNINRNSNGNAVLFGAGASAGYWSRTAKDKSYGYPVELSATGNLRMGDTNRNTGYSVRCVASGATWEDPSGNKAATTDLTTMQEITKSNFTNKYCANNATANALVPLGSTITLLDSRDGNKYKIIKMQDGTCWMVENLRLKGGITITPDNSQVNSNYTLPTNSAIDSDTINWGTDNDEDYMAEGSDNMKITSGGGSWKEAYGNYYSWCAATAMSCLENRTGAALNNADAIESICPKSWKLPVGTTGSGSFQNLYNQYPNDVASTYWLNDQAVSYNGDTTNAEYNGRRFGINFADAFFSAAGDIGVSDGLSDASIGGIYWSRRAHQYSDIAFSLYFNSDSVYPQRGNYRHYGFPVRCVAEPAE